MPAGLSLTEKAKIQKNLLLYGNKQLSQSEVLRINQEAAARGGLVYGSWFGGVEKYYSMSTAESISALAWVAAAVVPILSSARVISIGAEKVAESICLAAGIAT